MKESTKYLRHVLENWEEFNKQHPRLYTSIDKLVEYVTYLEATNEALRTTLRRVLFGTEKGDKQ